MLNVFFDYLKWLILLPEGYLILVVGAMLFYGLYAKSSEDNVQQSGFLNKYFYSGVITVIFGFILVVVLCRVTITGFNHLFQINPLSSAAKISLFASFLLILLVSKKNILSYLAFGYEYIFLVLMSFIGLSLLLNANDFISMFLSIEFASLPFYLLSIHRNFLVESHRSILKYFILSLVASAMFLYGVSFIYGITGFTSFNDIGELLVNYHDQNILLYFGVILVLFSLSFKLSFAPFHFWSIDVYSGLNYTLTLILNTLFKLVYAFALLKILWVALWSLRDFWWYIIYTLSLVSIIVGYIGAIYQRNIIKIIAFSGVVQMGFLAMTFLHKSNFSFTTFIIFLTFYIVANIGIFGILMSLKLFGLNIVNLDDLKGIAKKYPFYGLALSIFFLSIAGIPPLGGFFGKLFIVYLAIGSGFYVWSIVAVIASLVGMFYYVRIIKYAYSSPSLEQNALLSKSPRFLWNVQNIIIAFCVFFVLCSFVFVEMMSQSLKVIPVF